MARGFSKAIITGNVVRDPELRATSGGTCLLYTSPSPRD